MLTEADVQFINKYALFAKVIDKAINVPMKNSIHYFMILNKVQINEASEQQITDQASISKPVISTFVCTQQNTQSVCLAQVNVG